MTNGTVQEQGGGRTLVVRYQTSSQTISVPQNVVVTETVPINEKLKPGDTVNVLTQKQKDGTLTTNKVSLIASNPK